MAVIGQEGPLTAGNSRRSSSHPQLGFQAFGYCRSRLASLEAETVASRAVT